MPYLGVAPNPRENREVDDISSGFNGGTTQFTLQSGGSNVSPGSDTAIIVSLGGVVQNPGTDYTIAASTITFTTAPASGLSFFGVVLAQSVDIETPADGTVTTSKIVDGAVTNAKVNASAAIAGTKISPDFGSQNIVTTGTAATGALTVTGAITASTSITATNNLTTNGNFTISGTNPNIFLTDTNNDSDFRISNSNGILEFRDTTNSVTRFQIASDGTSTFSGDLTIPDTIVHAGDSNTKIRFPGNDAISFETGGGGEKVRFNNGGALFGTNTQRAGFFNTTSQFSPHFQIEGAGDSDDAGRTNSIIYNSTTNAGPVLIFGKTMGSSVGSTTAVTNGAQLGMISFQGLIGSEFTMGASITATVNGSIGDNDLPTDLQFATTSDGGSSAGEKMRLTAAGNLGIGTTSPSRKLEINSGIIDVVAKFVSSDSAATINLVDGLNADGVSIGSIDGNITFRSGLSTERMRIDSSGNVGIGTTSPGGSGLDVTSSRTTNYSTTTDQRSLAHIIARNGSDNTGRFASISLVSGGGTQAEGSLNLIQTGSYEGDLAFKLRTGGSSWAERMRILSDGAVCINATSRPVVGTEFLGVQGGSASNSVGIASVVSHNEGIPFFASNGSNTTSQRLMRFAAGSGGDTRGTITFNGSAMVYGGASDYRLKENITSISNGITKLKDLKPINFNWIKDETNTSIMGFLAHEVQEVMPQVVVGTKDEVNSEGKPEYQEIDLGGISPLIVAALQEAVAKIETLETKVAALEAA